MRAAIELTSISLEAIAFFFVTTDLYGEARMTRFTEMSWDF